MSENIQSAVESLLTKVQAAVEEAIADESRRAVTEAPRFNVFGLLGVSENQLSRLFASLLNPKGPHGQGTLFLEHFLDILGASLPQSSIVQSMKDAWISERQEVKVSIERTTVALEDRRRMDIELSGAGFALMIENKPWAGDQRNQLADYAKHLRLRYGGKFIIVYLSGGGVAPSKHSIALEEQKSLVADGSFAMLSYRTQVHKWLTDTTDKSQAPVVSATLKAAAAYIEVTFSDTAYA